MASPRPTIKSAFNSPTDEFDPRRNRRPVVFDILAPDYETSLLPDGMRMVLHVNPTTMDISYTKIIERIQTKGGYVEQHWGEGATTINFNMATGGFVRLYSGLSNITGGPGAIDTLGTRRETIAYDKFLDMLALFHNNGSVYDLTGKVVFQGILKITFDGGVYLGWFSTFTVTETADKPYQFALSSSFMVQQEIQRFRTMIYQPLSQAQFSGNTTGAQPTADAPLWDKALYLGLGGADRGRL